MDETIYLYGPPGSGKSTLGAELASRYGLDFIDLDDVIVEDAGGKSIPRIFADETEKGFRVRELAALKKVSLSGALVALGGGALLNPEARRVAESTGTVLFLDVPFEVLRKRIMAQKGTRPLADQEEKIANLLKARAEHYGSFGLRIAQPVELADETPQSRADRAEVALGRFRISSGDVPSDIFILSGGIVSLGAAAARRIAGRRAVVVADSNTAQLYADKVVASLSKAGISASQCIIPAGEETKNVSTVGAIWKAALDAKLGRKDFLVAVGGGVTGDLTGFAAATWMRGIDWVNVPTSLLSMVDASTGGKTGFDLPEGKNMVGAFHSPRVVCIDCDTLETLPERERRCGLAEAIKHAILADKALMNVPQAIDANYLSRVLSVKVRTVRLDPRETKGLRAKLNLGHTIGHAIEIATGFSVRHGEAVAIGCVEAAKMAARIAGDQVSVSWPFEVEASFAAVGLPTKLPEGVTLESLRPIMAHDKKQQNGMIPFVLPFGAEDVRLVSLPI